MRIQFFPTPELKSKLIDESNKLGVGVGTLVVDALNKYYGLVGPNTKTEAELEAEVLNEVALFVADPVNFGTEFDLNIASPTYTQIDMTYAGRPKVVKARIGKVFAKTVGTEGPFEKVRPVLLSNGNPKRTVGNRAAIYTIISG